MECLIFMNLKYRKYELPQYKIYIDNRWLIYKYILFIYKFYCGSFFVALNATH